MAEILVLVEHNDGAVKKVTLELLTLARSVGEPSAVFIGSGVDAAAATLAEYGAAKVYVADAPELTDYLVAPKAAVLAQLVKEKAPAAVLIASSAEGKEIAARLAIKTDSGVVYNSQVALDMIEQNIFGEGKTGNATASDLGSRRHNMIEAFKAVDHYSNAQFNHNTELGPNGQNDDLEAPSDKDRNEKHWDSQKLKDLGLLQGALEAAKTYQQTVKAAGEHAAPGEADLAAQCVRVAQTLVDNAERGMFTRAATIAAYGRAMREM